MILKSYIFAAVMAATVANGLPMYPRYSSAVAIRDIRSSQVRF